MSGVRSLTPHTTEFHWGRSPKSQKHTAVSGLGGTPRCITDWQFQSITDYDSYLGDMVPNMVGNDNVWNHLLPRIQKQKERGIQSENCIQWTQKNDFNKNRKGIRIIHALRVHNINSFICICKYICVCTCMCEECIYTYIWWNYGGFPKQYRGTPGLPF